MQSARIFPVRKKSMIPLEGEVMLRCLGVHAITSDSYQLIIGSKHPRIIEMRKDEVEDIHWYANQEYVQVTLPFVFEGVHGGCYFFSDERWQDGTLKLRAQDFHLVGKLPRKGNAGATFSAFYYDVLRKELAPFIDHLHSMNARVGFLDAGGFSDLVRLENAELKRSNKRLEREIEELKQKLESVKQALG